MSFSAKEAPEEMIDKRTPFSRAKSLAAYCRSSAFDQSDGPMLALEFEGLASAIAMFLSLIDFVIPEPSDDGKDFTLRELPKIVLPTPKSEPNLVSAYIFPDSIDVKKNNEKAPAS